VTAGRGMAQPAVAVDLTVPAARDMTALGRRLARLLRAGDLVLLSGPLGAGKTTLVQGIAGGLGVRGPVTSPTFVIARVHPSLSGGPDLVHADAYRLASPAEVDDLDLDASLERSVTVVEWGGGMAEGLAAGRLEVTITPATGAGGAASAAAGGAAFAGPASAGSAEASGADAGADSRPRTVRVAGLGERWRAVGESALLACLAGPQAV
jgi:tRNA threonylcarbamoyladenosine biosynthesis protein TsaE